MKAVRTEERPGARGRLKGAMRETVLLASDAGWELVLAEARAGTEVLPVPMARHELGYIISGRVRLTPLPPDYDPAEIDLDEARLDLGAGDAFAFDQGERVMIEVLEDLTFTYARPRATRRATT